MIQKKCRALDGMAHCVELFEDEAPAKGPPPETKEEKQAKKAAACEAKNADQLAATKAAWNPKEKHKDAGDAYKTLFVGRMAFETDEKSIRREFENYGPVKSVMMIKDQKGKPRGYCFVEYERERDMRTAYKQADGRKIDGRRVVVDVERGRTVNNWLPRKLGGGLGLTRKGGKDVNETYSGRAPSGGNEGRSERREDSRREEPRREERRDSRREDDRGRRDRSPDRRRDDRRDRDRDERRDSRR